MSQSQAGTEDRSERKEFNRLFWAARDEHVQFGEQGGEGPRHNAAMAFCEAHGWEWARELLIASFLEQSGRYDAAQTVLDNAKSLIPRWSLGTYRFLQAVLSHHRGELDEAIAGYRLAISDPEFTQPGNARNNLGISLEEKGLPDEALAVYREAVADPGYEMPGATWGNIGALLARRGDFDGAIAAYRSALADETFFKHSHVLASIALLNSMRGNLAEAERAANDALSAPDHSGGHARANMVLQLIRANISPEALSPDDRALVALPTRDMVPNEIESGIVSAIQLAGDSQYEKYMAKPESTRDDTLSILRGWSSAVTLLEGSERRWRGGGYFLKWRGYGFAIDPGFDFLRNFHDAGYHGREINCVIVSHNHPDHNSDLKDIDDLRYELFKRRAAASGAGNEPYVLLWDQDTENVTRFGFEQPRHQHEPVVMSSGFPQPFPLDKHAATLPMRVIPFKVNHGSDVPHALGFTLELLDAAGEVALRIGYTADTAYFDSLQGHLKGCDLLIAHISQPSIEELTDATKLKEVHLGYRGTARLLKECNARLSLIGEFWAGYTDLRIALVKGLRARSEMSAVLPAGLAMHIRLPSLDVECTECSHPTPFANVKVAPPTENFGSLAYLCPNCMIG